MKNKDKTMPKPILKNSKKEFNINRACAKLFIDEPFYAAISRYVVKKQNNNIETACVYVSRNGKLNLEYNSEFMNSLSEVQQKGVIIHELKHIGYGHLTGRMPEGSRNRKIWNIATDLCINSDIKREWLPEFGMIPGEKEFVHFPKHKCSEWYYNELKRIFNEKQIEELGDTLDDHGKWAISESESGDSGKVVEIDHEINKELIKKIVREAVNEAEMRGWGSVSHDSQYYIKDSLKVKINWKQILKNFIHTSLRGDKVNTRKKINRRYGIIHPGKKTEKYANICIAIDMSGSVSDQMLEIFFSCLGELSNLVTFTVVPFDSEIDEENIFVWKRKQKITAKRTRCGGTDFQAPTDYINKESKFDGLVILTDLEAPIPTQCNVPRIWITDYEHGKSNNFQTNEQIVIIE